MQRSSNGGQLREVEEASYTTSGALLLKLLYSKSYWIGIGPIQTEQAFITTVEIDKDVKIDSLETALDKILDEGFLDAILEIFQRPGQALIITVEVDKYQPIAKLLRTIHQWTKISGSCNSYKRKQSVKLGCIPMKGFNLKENQEREDTVAFMLIIHFLLTLKVVNNIHKRGGTIPRDITWKLRYIKDCQ
ncbi:hypothetical protein QYF36_022781 [Acer negundo]|nr:hypothetical protein QYF36_022781 [Acer negundo]